MSLWLDYLYIYIVSIRRLIHASNSLIWASPMQSKPPVHSLAVHDLDLSTKPSSIDLAQYELDAHWSTHHFPALLHGTRSNSPLSILLDSNFFLTCLFQHSCFAPTSSSLIHRLLVLFFFAFILLSSTAFAFWKFVENKYQQLHFRLFVKSVFCWSKYQQKISLVCPISILLKANINRNFRLFVQSCWICWLHTFSSLP